MTKISSVCIKNMPRKPVWVQADRVPFGQQLFATYWAIAAQVTPPSGRIIIDVDVDAEAEP